MNHSAEMQKKCPLKVDTLFLLVAKKYVVGTHHESALKANTAADAVSSQFRHIAPHAAGNKLNVLA